MNLHAWLIVSVNSLVFYVLNVLASCICSASCQLEFVSLISAFRMMPLIGGCFFFAIIVVWKIITLLLLPRQGTTESNQFKPNLNWVN